MVSVCFGVEGHDYRGCYVIGDLRLNLSRSWYSILPAAALFS